MGEMKLENKFCYMPLFKKLLQLCVLVFSFNFMLVNAECCPISAFLFHQWVSSREKTLKLSYCLIFHDLSLNKSKQWLQTLTWYIIFHYLMVCLLTIDLGVFPWLSWIMQTELALWCQGSSGIVYGFASTNTILQYTPGFEEIVFSFDFNYMT